MRRVAEVRASWKKFAPAAAAVLLVAATWGCSDRSSGKFAGKVPEETKVPVKNDAELFLERMIARYQRADSYGDRGELRINFRREGRPFETKVPFSVVLARPNKLQMHYYQGHVVCDGQHLWGWTEDLPGYLLKRPASGALTLGDLSVDDVLWSVINEGQAGGSLQLAMLLGTDAMDLIRAGGERPELLADDVLNGRPCRRVRVRRGDGNLTYWIESDSLALRRIEYPTRNLALTLAEASKPADVTMTADFIDPQFDLPISPEAFQFDPPPQIKIVDRLDPYVAVPPPPPLVQTLGQKLGDVPLSTLDGKPIAAADLAGKTTVLLFWSLGSSECLPVLARVNQVYAQFRERKDVQFWVVSLDSGEVQDVVINDVRTLLAEHKVQVPAARISTQQALATFDVRYVPNLYLIGPDGTVQDSEVGLNKKLEEELTARIERLTKGESLVADTRARHEQWTRRYEQAQQTQAATGGGAALPQAASAPAAEPKTLKMKRLWQTTEVKQPGYVLATDARGGSPQIIVADGLRAVAELDAQGKLVRRIDLELPVEPLEAVITFWRTAVDKQGRRLFVGSAGAQQQLHLFDRDFKKLLSYPEGTHAGISDVQLADLDGDGEPEMNVGYWGVVGVQNLALDGTRRWANRRLPENVLRLAATHLDSRGKRLLLCNTGVMTVAVIDEEGRTLKEMPIGSRAVRLVAVDDLTGDGGIEMCGIATTGPGSDSAVGFDAVGKELWSYPLPAGVHAVPTMQNEMIAAGKLLPGEAGMWIFAGADGSVHFVSHEGKPVDRFAWGEPIHGLAVGAIDGAATLFISDAKSVTALQFSR